jgi:eukaryotic-like serine/threonine-protein kinase
VDLARRLDRPNELARAVLGICFLAEAGVVDEPLIALLEEALAVVGEEDSPLRSQLLSGLAAGLYWIDPAGRSNELGLEALEMARRLDDPGSLALALVRRQFTGGVGPKETERRLREASEMHDLAKRRGDLELEMRSHVYRLVSRLELGDIVGVDADLAAYQRLAGELRQPQYLWHIPLLRGMRALIDGRFEDAEELAAEALAGGERAQEPVSAMFNAIQDSQLRRTRRRPEDVRRIEDSLPLLGELVERYPAIPAWRCSLAATHAELGNAGEARAVFEPLAANQFEDLPFDAQWMISLTLLAETAAFLGDVPRAERLYGLLLPHDGLTVVAGRAAVCQGPVARVLGVVAAAAGRASDAERHFTDALAMSERMGDRPMTGRARVDLGRLLLDRDGRGDRERALELLGTALESAQEIGMVGLTQEALAARLEAQGLTSLDTTTSIDFMIEAVSSEQPDIAAYAAPDGQVTILFSDIEDSTLITERLGDERWLEVLRAHNALFRRLVPAHGGFEVKNQGDGFMLVFPDSRRAVECAAAIQRGLAEGDLEGERVRVRIGMHAGEAIREEGDFFGRSVIVAARIAAQACGGEILVSEALKERAEAADGGAVPGLGFDGGREIELKGLAGTHRVYRADWEQAVPA